MIAYARRNLKYLKPDNWRQGAKAIRRRITRSGVIDDPDDLGMATLLPAKKLDLIINLHAPRSVIDVGCGTGASLKYMVGRGLDVLGVEASAAAIEVSGVAGSIFRHDLRKPLNLARKFDLVWCFEVAEHLHASHVETFLDTLACHGDLIVMSAAPPGQGGEGHLNEQPQEYWIEKLARRGFALHSEWTAQMQSVPEFYSENMMVFQRS